MDARELVNNDVIFTDTSIMTHDQWLEHRLSGIGCSEFGTIMGLNQWESPVELFHKKLGLIPQKIKDNPALYWGRSLEANVAEAWEYWSWENDQWEKGGYIENVDAGEKIRECTEIHYYMQSKEHEWLFGSPDRIIVDEEPGILEIKTISGFSSDQYEGGIPPSYIAQIQAYMLLMGYEYAEMCILKDGRDMSVVRFERNETIIESIIEHGNMFWDLVLQGREILQEGDAQDLVNIEPQWGKQTDAYHDYQKSRYDVVAGTEVIADDDSEKAFFDYLKAKSEETHFKHAKRDAEIVMKDYMGEAEKLTISDTQYVTWKADKNDVRRFKVTNK